MRSIQIIGILNVLFGIGWFYAPTKFYSISMKLFTPEVSPPFESGAIRNITFLLVFPAIVLILNGIALYILGDKMERVPEIKTYTESGKYMGRLKRIDTEEGEVETFEIEEEIFEKEEVVAVDDVLLIKEEEELKGPAEKHELIGKEVYTKKGIYLGKVESVNLDQDGRALKFTATRGDKKQVFSNEDIETSNDVIIVKS